MASLRANGQDDGGGTYPGGRRRRRPATGAERDRRDAWAKTWAPAGREIADRRQEDRST